LKTETEDGKVIDDFQELVDAQKVQISVLTKAKNSGVFKKKEQPKIITPSTNSEISPEI